MDPDLDFRIPTLGPPTVPSPLGLSTRSGDDIADYTSDDERVLLDLGGRNPAQAFERAGPRATCFFRPDEVVAGIVNCGGLCPGMNDVIRALVRQLWNGYGVRRILGFRYGFLGLSPRAEIPPITLDPRAVADIHLQGGTILGSSRGHQEPTAMADTLDRLGVNALFVVGGDGTMRGAQALYEEVSRRGRPVAIVGVPKTIDNDLLYVERTFGFETAVSIATQAIRAAHVEAEGAPRGVGLVRLMGRHSGYITASAARASGEADLVLIPELPFDLEGPQGVLAYLRQRIQDQSQAVVVVAEGAGQRYVARTDVDASGNRKLGDIGLFLKDLLGRELADLGVNLKYIDPSYIIRAAPANPADAIFCSRLAANAVHAALSGRTAVVVGLWGNLFTHVPLAMVTRGRHRLSTDGTLWRSVLELTGQPPLFTGPGSGGEAGPPA